MKILKEKVDSCISVFVGSFMSLGILFGAASVVFAAFDGSYGAWMRALAILFGAWCLAVEGWYLVTSWCAVARNLHPVAIAIALQQPRLPPILRPIAMIWWSFKFLMGLVWSCILTIMEKDFSTIGVIALGVITSGFAYLTYGYALLAITSLSKNPSILSRVWRWRARWAWAHLVAVLAVEYLARLR